MSKAAYQELCSIKLLRPQYLGTSFLAPLPIASYVAAPGASLGFLMHPKAVFASGLPHLFPLPGILFLLQVSVESHFSEAFLAHLIQNSPSSHPQLILHDSFPIVFLAVHFN